ncbi:polyprenyl synthetase family protein [Aspergillus tanneri]|uniref:Geranylgeranyl pyrophosphate synthase n=1 Tax=Aspergillus tanneri TaxID=1220188 RepID=A0A5M9N6B4_9EURO|nr:Geranylgeranyl pyrophosphate synthase [Aspergillus tanneri]KAA8652639.1 Geranylgeranyl pyrophosphate synthase [Aspergillus tanneri]
MSTYQGYPFQFSEQFQPIGIPQGRFQSTLPVRVSKFADQIQNEAEKVQEKLAERLGTNSKSLARSGTTTSHGNIISWIFPECPPSWITFLAEVAELTLYFDDVTDTLDKASHDEILSNALASVPTGEPGTSDSSIMATFSHFLDIPDRITFLSELEDVFLAQTAHVGKSMSFEEFQTFKIRHSGSRLFANLIARFNGQQVSQQERDSIAYFTDKLMLSTSLMNDLNSFHKEFEEHSARGNIETIGNVMALLMSGYGYEEGEAASIVKQEILTLEKQGLEEFHAWHSSNLAKSPNLVGYAFTVLTYLGGLNYWMSHSERYFRTDLRTTAKDRATLVRNSASSVRRLKNYPVPQAINGPDTSILGICSIFSDCPSNTNNFERNGQEAASEALVNRGGCTGMDLCVAPYDYIRSLPGKGTMARMVDAMHAWFCVPTESSETIKALIVMIFNSSLMLDDIQDDSLKRRGMPAAHVVHGVGQTVNSVSYMGLKVLRLCEDLRHSSACRKVLYDELEALFSGQALELYWKFHKQCPTMSDYLVMIDKKTGGFFRVVMRVMAAEASSPIPWDSDLVRFISLLGRYYQIRDDYQNLVSEEYAAKKGFCEDLSEGKFSVVLIHTLQNSLTADRVRGLVFGGARIGMSDEIRSYILSEMNAAGSLEYTRCILADLHQRLLRMLDDIEATMGENKPLRNLILFLKV